MEEFIPTFEEIKFEETNDLQVSTDFKDLIVQVDEFEDKLKEYKKLESQYKDIKDKIKEAMVKLGRENELEQVKWITPNGIKITCSIGHKPIFEETTEKEFSLEMLKNKHPEIYEECLVERTYDKLVKEAKSDRLVITTPKGE